MYADCGRSSIPPERLLKAKVLQALFSVRSDRQLVVRIRTDLLFRWFLDMNLDETVFDATVFTQNQGRLVFAVGNLVRMARLEAAYGGRA